MALTTVPASLSATALTLTTAAQPNITSVGTLTGLTVSGNIAGTLTTAAQTNITSVGTLSSLTVSGALNGTLSTAAQTNITSLGTLTGLTTSGNVGIGTASTYNMRATIAGAGSALSTGTGSYAVASIYDTATPGVGTGGALAFQGDDGTNSAVTFATINGSKENSTSGNYASFLSFHTRANAGNVTEQMRIASNGNVGIGESNPGQKLQVAGNIQIENSGNPNLTVKATGAGNNPLVRIRADNNYWDIQSLFSNTYNELDFRYNGTSVMIMNNQGSVGIGVTPPAWYTGGSLKSLQVGSSTALFNLFGTRTVLADNYYLQTGTGTDKYITTNEASQYYQEAGKHRFFRAASGSAGATISWTESMQIDASGNVGIGTSSPNSYSGQTAVTINSTGVSRLDLDISNTVQGYVLAESSYAAIYAVAGNYLGLGVAGAPGTRIDANGKFLHGTTAVPTGVLLGNQLVSSSATGSEIIAFRADTSVAVGDKCGALLIGNSDPDGAEDHFVGMWGKVSSTNGSQDLHFAAGRSGYEGDSPTLTLKNGGDLKIVSGMLGIGMDATQALDIDRTSGLSLRFYNSGTFKAGLQVANSAGQMVGTSAADDLAIRSQSDIVFGAGGNTERMRVKSNGDIQLGGDAYRFVDVVYRRSYSLNRVYTHVANIDSSSLGCSYEVYVNGTTSGVVVNAHFHIMVGHYFDIAIKSFGNAYTACKVKVVSNGNEDNSLYIGAATTNNATFTGVVSIRPHGATGVDMAPSSGYSTCYLEHAQSATSSQETTTGGATSGSGPTNAYGV